MRRLSLAPSHHRFLKGKQRVGKIRFKPTRKLRGAPAVQKKGVLIRQFYKKFVKNGKHYKKLVRVFRRPVTRARVLKKVDPRKQRKLRFVRPRPTAFRHHYTPFGHSAFTGHRVQKIPQRKLSFTNMRHMKFINPKRSPVQRLKAQHLRNLYKMRGIPHERSLREVGQSLGEKTEEEKDSLNDQAPQPEQPQDRKLYDLPSEEVEEQTGRFQDLMRQMYQNWSSQYLMRNHLNDVENLDLNEVHDLYTALKMKIKDTKSLLDQRMDLIYDNFIKPNRDN